MKLRLLQPLLPQRVFIGIDNGSSGSIGVVGDNYSDFVLTPTFRDLNYTKKKGWTVRISAPKLEEILKPYQGIGSIVMERPMINSQRFKATVSACRALEATLIVIEKLGFPFSYQDSKIWQKALLPSGIKGPELKSASLAVGKRLFPHLKNEFKKDADGILIAESAYRQSRTGV